MFYNKQKILFISTEVRSSNNGFSIQQTQRTDYSIKIFLSSFNTNGTVTESTGWQIHETFFLKKKNMKLEHSIGFNQIESNSSETRDQQESSIIFDGRTLKITLENSLAWPKSQACEEAITKRYDTLKPSVRMRSVVNRQRPQCQGLVY